MAVGKRFDGPVHSVAGVKLAAVKSNIRYPDRLDLVLMEIAPDSTVAGVFTRNAFCAAPVQVAREHLQQISSRYFLINTGNANAGTGESGYDHAKRSCQAVARQMGISETEVLPFSTGVIGEALPLGKILAAIPSLADSLAADAWQDAALGIMTTDTREKLSSRQLQLADKAVNITGMAKGSGMIRPDMATMLAYIFTDLDIDAKQLHSLLNTAVNNSFNRITVDGDTSTNDCCMLVATGQSGLVFDALNATQQAEYRQALQDVFTDLATGLIRDAEGASKFITIIVEGGVDSDECLRVAYTVAESPLVKTALFASDPNWGRILAAVGRAGLSDLLIENVAIYLGDQLIAINGAVAPQYREELGQMEMDKEEIEMRIKLGRGDASETVWTSDLSHDYVRINAEYRT